MNVIMTSVRWSKAFSYPPNITILTRTAEEHISNVEEVLALVRNVGVILKLQKCRFYRVTIDYLLTRNRTAQAKIFLPVHKT